jgi:predicted nucleic acid-binding protein
LKPKYLLDTSVISVFAPGRPQLPQAFERWMNDNEHRLHLSSLTLFEIEQGAAKLERAGGSKRAALCRAWISEVADRFGSRVLPLDALAATLAGTISDGAHARGGHPGLIDVFIAAIANESGLVLLTRNVKHFAPLGIAVADPLISLPD